MARNFNGTTDRIDFANPFDFQAQPLTLSLWVNLQNTATVGYMAHIHVAGDASYGIGLRANTGQIYGFFRGSTVGTDKWRPGATTWSTGTWYNLIVTDPGATFTDYTEINMYRNGASDNGTGVNGSIAEKSFGGSLSVGGRIYSDDRNISGYVAEVGWWNRVLSAGEIGALAAGFSPVFIRNGLVSYTSLVRTALDQMTGSFGTLDGTSVIEHPPIIYPSAPVFYSLPTVAAGETLSVDIGPTNNTIQGVKVIG